jgi:hypothetical protein
MRREDTKYWRRNAEGRLVYVPVERERSPQYLKRLVRHMARQKATTELFELFDETIATVLPCRCSRCVKYCQRCAELMARLERAVAAQPWKRRRDTLFPTREAAWTNIWIVE